MKTSLDNPRPSGHASCSRSRDDGIDDGILVLVVARLKAESQLSTTDLRFALDILGCGPDVGQHSWFKPRALSQMRSMLAYVSLMSSRRGVRSTL